MVECLQRLRLSPANMRFSIRTVARLSADSGAVMTNLLEQLVLACEHMRMSCSRNKDGQEREHAAILHLELLLVGGIGFGRGVPDELGALQGT